MVYYAIILFAVLVCNSNSFGESINKNFHNLFKGGLDQQLLSTDSKYYADFHKNDVDYGVTVKANVQSKNLRKRELSIPHLPELPKLPTIDELNIFSADSKPQLPTLPTGFPKIPILNPVVKTSNVDGTRKKRDVKGQKVIMGDEKNDAYNLSWKPFTRMYHTQSKSRNLFKYLGQSIGYIKHEIGCENDNTGIDKKPMDIQESSIKKDIITKVSLILKKPEDQMNILITPTTKSWETIYKTIPSDQRSFLGKIVLKNVFKRSKDNLNETDDQIVNEVTIPSINRFSYKSFINEDNLNEVIKFINKYNIGKNEKIANDYANKINMNILKNIQEIEKIIADKSTEKDMLIKKPLNLFKYDKTVKDSNEESKEIIHLNTNLRDPEINKDYDDADNQYVPLLFDNDNYEFLTGEEIHYKDLSINKSIKKLMTKNEKYEEKRRQEFLKTFRNTLASFFDKNNEKLSYLKTDKSIPTQSHGTMEQSSELQTTKSDDKEKTRTIRSIDNNEKQSEPDYNKITVTEDVTVIDTNAIETNTVKKNIDKRDEDSEEVETVLNTTTTSTPAPTTAPTTDYYEEITTVDDYDVDTDCPTDIIMIILNAIKCLFNSITSALFGIEFGGCCH